MKTYKEQFDKLTEAYIGGKIKPFESCDCFIGNLLGNDGRWQSTRIFTNVLNPSAPIKDCERTEDSLKSDVSLSERGKDAILEMVREGRELIKSAGYSPEEIWRLERTFLLTFINQRGIDRKYCTLLNDNDELALFIAFDKTLDLLKEIHEAKGEVVDKPIFVRRVLQPA